MDILSSSKILSFALSSVAVKLVKDDVGRIQSGKRKISVPAAEMLSSNINLVLTGGITSTLPKGNKS